MRILFIIFLIQICESAEQQPQCATEFRHVLDEFMKNEHDAVVMQAVWSLFTKNTSEHCREYSCGSIIDPVCWEESNDYTPVCDFIYKKAMSDCAVYDMPQEPDCRGIMSSLLNAFLYVGDKEEKFTSLLTKVAQVPCVNSKETEYCTHYEHFCETHEDKIESVGCPLIMDIEGMNERISSASGVSLSSLRNHINEGIRNTSLFRGFAETFLQNEWVPDANISLKAAGCSISEMDTEDPICQAIFFRCKRSHITATQDIEPIQKMCSEIPVELLIPKVIPTTVMAEETTEAEKATDAEKEPDAEKETDAEKEAETEKETEPEKEKKAEKETEPEKDKGAEKDTGIGEETEVQAARRPGTGRSTWIGTTWLLYAIGAALALLC